jgi:hypothetical protein
MDQVLPFIYERVGKSREEIPDVDDSLLEYCLDIITSHLERDADSKQQLNDILSSAPTNGSQRRIERIIRKSLLALSSTTPDSTGTMTRIVDLCFPPSTGTDSILSSRDPLMSLSFRNANNSSPLSRVRFKKGAEVIKKEEDSYFRPRNKYSIFEDTNDSKRIESTIKQRSITFNKNLKFETSSMGSVATAVESDDGAIASLESPEPTWHVAEEGVVTALSLDMAGISFNESAAGSVVSKSVENSNLDERIQNLEKKYSSILNWSTIQNFFINPIRGIIECRDKLNFGNVPKLLKLVSVDFQLEITREFANDIVNTFKDVIKQVSLGNISKCLTVREILLFFILY